MTVPPTEAPPSKRSTSHTMSGPRAARGPRSAKSASRTTIRVERRGSRAQSSYSFILLSLSLSLSSHHACIAARSAARRSTSYRHAARHCCGRDDATSKTRDRCPRRYEAFSRRLRCCTFLSNSLANACRQPMSASRSRYVFILTGELPGGRRDRSVRPYETPGSSRCESHHG